MLVDRVVWVACCTHKSKTTAGHLCRPPAKLDYQLSSIYESLLLSFVFRFYCFCPFLMRVQKIPKFKSGQVLGGLIPLRRKCCTPRRVFHGLVSTDHYRNITISLFIYIFLILSAIASLYDTCAYENFDLAI